MWPVDISVLWMLGCLSSRPLPPCEQNIIKILNNDLDFYNLIFCKQFFSPLCKMTSPFASLAAFASLAIGTIISLFDWNDIDWYVQVISHKSKVVLWRIVLIVYLTYWPNRTILICPGRPVLLPCNYQTFNFNPLHMNTPRITVSFENIHYFLGYLCSKIK